MLSAEQLAEEQKKEAEYNKLFETVISKSPFGQWYGLMIGASNLLTKNLPKRVGIDSDGRPLVVYKGDVNKLLGVWATPTHKVIAQDLSRGKVGDALGALLGIGQIKETIKQKKAKFFDISPEDIRKIYNRKNSKNNEPTDIPNINKIGENKKVPIQKSSPTSKNNYKPILIIGTTIVVASFLGYLYFKKN